MALCRNLLHRHIAPYLVPVCAGVWLESGLFTLNHIGRIGIAYDVAMEARQTIEIQT